MRNRKLNPKKMAKLKQEYAASIDALIRSNFHRDKAAQLLNISRRTLYNRLKKAEEVGLHPANTT